MSKSIKRTMVVDDEESLREIICEVLNMLDIEAITAEDGLQAIEKAREEQNPIDLFFIDLFMPNLSGEETYKKLSQIFPDRPVIFMSGYDQDMAPKGKRNYKFLKKPFSIVQIKNIVESFQ